MTDIQNNEPDIEDRSANIRMTVQHIIDSNLDSMFDRFDRLKKRGINDDDMVEALRYLGPIDLLDDYAEWAEIDLREGGDGGVVPDPASAPSYKDHPLNQRPAGITTVEQLAQLDDGTVVVLNGGKAAQIVRDGTQHTLSIIGWDGWLHIMEPDDDWNWEIVSAEGRREIAAFLPATILGESK